MPVSQWFILGTLALASLWGIFSYNRLVSMRQGCDRSFADIDVLLKRRHDLVPNLVDTVKGYAGHERGAFEAVVAARSAALTAKGPAAKGQSETVLGAALRRLFALSEAYPNLKADMNFRKLQSALSDTENEIAASRRAFNAMVRGYNTMIQRFPMAPFARTFGFKPHEFFTVGDERASLENAPDVRL